MRVVSFGECMLELQGEAFGAMQQTFGGDTLNTAVYLARCGRRHGIEVSYATGLGDDALSAGMMQRWAAEGIDLAFVRRIPGRMPGLYLIEVDPAGERRFSYWREQSAARAYFDAPPGDTPLEARADEIDALYFSGISLAILPPAARARLWAVAERLRGRGATVAFDNNYRPRLWPDAATAREAFARALALASIALLTLDDDIALWGDGATAPDAQLARALDAACPEVVVKRGSAPTLVRVAGQAPAEAATEPVPRVVDTTAAGDSFAGGYLAARFAGASALDAARAGNRLAARVVQHRGALIAPAAMADLMAAPAA
ncbi:MAG TPA: sugar kinase [Burkholderiaceae bacterium]|nr:sugar kinase [Burkholderiaceae bacterium]